MSEGSFFVAEALGMFLLPVIVVGIFLRAQKIGHAQNLSTQGLKEYTVMSFDK
jgi:hypothetical protein